MSTTPQITKQLEDGADWDAVLADIIDECVEAATWRNGADEVYTNACRLVAQVIGKPAANVTIPISDLSGEIRSHPSGDILTWYDDGENRIVEEIEEGEIGFTIYTAGEGRSDVRAYVRFAEAARDLARWLGEQQASEAQP